MSAQAEELQLEAAPKAVRRGLSREITLGRSKSKAAPAPTKPKAAASVGLVIGAEPTVTLLPPEVHAVAKARATRNVVFFALIGVVVLVGIAAAASSVLATNAQTHASLKQQEVQGLLLQQSKYTPVLKVKQNVALAQAAERAVTTQQIDWKPFFGQIVALLPKGVTVSGMTGAINSAGNNSQGQTKDPLSTASAATVTIQVSGASPDAIAATMDALSGVTGYISAGIANVAGQTDAYSTTITLTVSRDAFSQRFQTSAQ